MKSTERSLEPREAREFNIRALASYPARSLAEWYHKAATEREHLDQIQGAFQEGIGLARLELTGDKPDTSLVLQRLDRACAKVDELREAFHAG